MIKAWHLCARLLNRFVLLLAVGVMCSVPLIKTAVYLVTAFRWYTCITYIPSRANGYLKYPLHKYMHYEREKE